MPRVKQFNEEEALQKALHLFWDKGYHATSMQELVDTMGISRASLYDTYGDKKQLFEKAFSAYITYNAKLLKDHFANNTGVKQAFEKLFEQNIEQTVSDSRKKGCFVVNTAAECTPDDFDFIRLVEANNTQVQHTFKEALTLAKTSGELKPSLDVESTASMLYTMMNGIRILGKTNSNKEQLLNSAKAALRLLD